MPLLSVYSPFPAMANRHAGRVERRSGKELRGRFLWWYIPPRTINRTWIIGNQPAMPVPIVCPACGASYEVADDLRGRSVLCRDCGKPIRVADETSSPREAIRAEIAQPSPPPEQGESGGRSAAPREEGPVPQVLPLRQSYAVARVAGIAAMLLLLLSAATVFGILWWSGWFWEQGEWPPPEWPRRAPADKLLTLHVLGVAAEDEAARQKILEAVVLLTDKDSPYLYVASTENGRMTILVTRVSDPEAFARQIDFGIVRRVRDRVITISAKKG